MRAFELDASDYTDSVVAELARYEPHDRRRPVTVASLASFEEGDVVTYGSDGKIGVVTAKMTSTFNWPSSDDGTEEIEASSDEPVYIIARETGGAKPFDPDDLSSISMDDAFGDTDDDAEPEAIEDAELAGLYTEVDDPFDLDQVEQLVNAPGVDDPEVGFSSWPDSWRKSDKPARLIALRAWANLGGTFTSCVSEMSGEISRPKKFCAAFKDEILGTERWRNRF